MIWFFSDSHLQHDNIRKHCNRPFNSVEEMNDTIINNFNSVVDEKDTVYFIGDFGFFYKNNGGGSVRDEIYSWIRKFKQVENWYWILGNHDKKYSSTFDANICYDILDIMIENQPVTLCHYPMLTFNKSHFNAWQLYGHHHSDISNIATGKKMNVSVDVNNFFPVSWEQVKEYMKNRNDNWDLIKKE